MEVMLREADGDTIDAVMEAHEADLCLDAGGATRSVEWLPLCRDQLMAVLPKGHRLARERRYRWKRCSRNGCCCL